MKLHRIFSIAILSAHFILGHLSLHLPVLRNGEKSIYSKTRMSRSDCIVVAFVARKGKDNAEARARLAEIIRVSGERLHSFPRPLFPTPANFPAFLLRVADQRILSLLQLFSRPGPRERAIRLLFVSQRRPSSLRKDSYVVGCRCDRPRK